MDNIDRRRFLLAAAALGAQPLLAGEASGKRAAHVTERRDLYPEGVASGDPDHESVILWTRRPSDGQQPVRLRVEIASDPDFDTIVAATRVETGPASDWTCRVLAAGLRPSTVYWYRFVDPAGCGSRVGRTRTAPRPDEPMDVRFAFVSCQSVNEGYQNALRRLAWEDARASDDRRLDFLLHLGDFIYEVVQYPDETQPRPGGVIRDIGRVPDARKVGPYHVPTTLAGYRMVYRAHLADPDIQDARALLPFVCIGDNHEFSWQGWQSFVKFDGPPEPAPGLRVAANQAWWEFIPSRVRKSSGPGLVTFDGPVFPAGQAAAAQEVDDRNKTAIASMTAYRTFRWGSLVELAITDLHSYAMEDPTSTKEASALDMPEFPFLMPEETLRALDAGREFEEGAPPERVGAGKHTIANYRKDGLPFSVLGQRQKTWLKEKLAQSNATWKIWAATNATLDMRADPLNIPAGTVAAWPGQGYATFGGGDFSAALYERAELYDHVRAHAIDGFVVVSGDRHSFWAGYAAAALPPAKFQPVGIAFVVGSISAPTFATSLDHALRDHPLRGLYVTERSGAPEPTLNLLLKHGVRSALEYASSGDLARARAVSNPDVAPHVEFVDMDGHGYAIVTATADAISTEFVCVPRPVTSAKTPDGGPLRYRVAHEARRWRRGERPTLRQRIVEGDPGLAT